MSLVIGQEEKNDFGRIEDGTYGARLVQVVDFGVQPIEDFNTGEVKGHKQRVWLQFEFPDERIEVNGEDKPRWQGKEYTVSYNEKANLPQIIKALDPNGKAESLAELIGNAAMITIGSTKNKNAKITGIVPCPKGMKVGELENPATVFDLSEPDLETFKNLPEWMQEKITSSKKFDESPLSDMLSDDFSTDDDAPDLGDDDVPFDDDAEDI